jgi:glycosyltransferase involved in cell wall biosynthesis
MSSNDRRIGPTGWSRHFDAVVMLTWSDWKTEPRSNRYHYATRFARELPVLFVQPDNKDWKVTSEPVPGTNIEIMHVPENYGDLQSTCLERELHRRGIFRPLLWIYNVFFEDFVRRSDADLKIYHATEDYLTPPERWAVGSDVVHEPLRRLLVEVDLMVAVSEGVANSYRERGGYRGRMIVLCNGCDYEFWQQTQAACYQAPRSGQKVALYQGGINSRLDFKLLSSVADTLPDWQFWFCGNDAYGGPAWQALCRRPNVRHFGQLLPDQIAELARESLVGLIPFRQDELIRRSLPLKAYEYAACGLPVVTVPIDALSDYPELFTVARTAAEFSTGIVSVAATRLDAVAIERRLAEAKANSYDRHFETLAGELAELVSTRPPRARRNVLILYDDAWAQIETVHEHLASFQNYSAHNIFYMCGANDSFPSPAGVSESNLDIFDVLVIHSSLAVSSSRLSIDVAQATSSAGCLKIAFLPEPYDQTAQQSLIEGLGVHAVFANVPAKPIERAKIDFIPTVSGYMSDRYDIEKFCQPLKSRNIVIGYRQRKLPRQISGLEVESSKVARRLHDLAQNCGVKVDIEVADDHDMSIDDWHRFVGSCRAIIVIENGPTKFDLECLTAHPNTKPPPVEPNPLHQARRAASISQITPAILAAVRLRTALIMFDGQHPDIVAPDRHFIPLKTDYSNIGEVFQKLDDLDFLRQLTDRAYEELIKSGRYSYKQLIEEFDGYITSRLSRQMRSWIISAPVAVAQGSKLATFRSLWPATPPFWAFTNFILGRSLSALDYNVLVQPERGPVFAGDAPRLTRTSKALKQGARRAWRQLPVSVRMRFGPSLRRTALAFLNAPKRLTRIWPPRK